MGAPRVSRVGKPGEPGMAQVVTAQMRIPKFGDDLIPMRGVPQKQLY